jgi:hypothetical protein
MTPDTLQALLQLGVVRVNPFPPTSRYSTVATAMYTTSTGKEVVYLRRRFVPPAASLAVAQVHRLLQGERLDLVANTYLGDPLAFWRICDANSAIDPDELIAVVGRELEIPLPPGVAGMAGGQ